MEKSRASVPKGNVGVDKCFYEKDSVELITIIYVSRPAFSDTIFTRFGEIELGLYLSLYDNCQPPLSLSLSVAATDDDDDDVDVSGR